MIAEISSVAISGRMRQEDGSGLSSLLIEQLVCCLDLLSTLYSCLPDDCVGFTARFRLLPRLFTVLAAQNLDHRVSDISVFGIVSCVDFFPHHCSISFQFQSQNTQKHSETALWLFAVLSLRNTLTYLLTYSKPPPRQLTNPAKFLQFWRPIPPVVRVQSISLFANLGKYHVQQNKTSRTARTMIPLIAALETCE